MVHVGGGRCVRVVRGRETEEGRSTGESERGPEGAAGWRRGEDVRRRGGQATQADSLVAWRPRAPVRSSLPAWREEAGGWHGPAQCWAG